MLALSSCTARSADGSAAAPPGAAAQARTGGAPSSVAPAAQSPSASGRHASPGAVPRSDKAGKTSGSANGASRAAGPTEATPSSASGSLAYVSFVSGKVVGARTPVSSGGGAAAAPPSGGSEVGVGDPVDAGESLATGAGSLLQVLVGSSYELSLGRSSLLRFDAIDPPPAGSPRSFRLALTLEKGSLVVKAGRTFLHALPAKPSGAAPEPALLLEVSTPRLFLSSRGGVLLVSDTGEAARCAVGPGSAWLLPRSIVYPKVIAKVPKPALDLLNGILAKAVPLSRDTEITVLAASLAPIDTVGSAIREILASSEGEARLSQPTMEALTGLARKAALGVSEAIGKPTAISSALRKELDPQSVAKQKMKVTSVSENGQAVTTASSAEGQASAASSTGDQGSAVSASPQAATTDGASQSAAPAGQRPVPPAGAPRQGATATSSGPASSGTPGTGSQPANSSSGSATGTDTFPGPTPPTPPTPPTAPR